MKVIQDSFIDKPAQGLTLLKTDFVLAHIDASLFWYPTHSQP